MPLKTIRTFNEFLFYKTMYSISENANYGNFKMKYPSKKITHDEV